MDIERKISIIFIETLYIEISTEYTSKISFHVAMIGKPPIGALLHRKNWKTRIHKQRGAKLCIAITDI